jgi:hypothetical protein
LVAVLGSANEEANRVKRRRRYTYWGQQDDSEKMQASRLKAAINSFDLPERCQTFLETRWLPQIEHWELEVRHARKIHRLLRILNLVFGLSVTVFAGISAIVGANWVNYLTLASGTIVSFSVGLQAIFQFGDGWRVKRTAAEKLKVEG